MVDPIKNPFAPEAGTPPPELAGPDKLRATVRIALGRSRLGNPAKSIQDNLTIVTTTITVTTKRQVVLPKVIRAKGDNHKEFK